MAVNELEEDVLGMLLNEDESTDLLLDTGQRFGCNESGSVWDVSRDQLEDLRRDMESRGLVRSQLELYNGARPGLHAAGPLVAADPGRSDRGVGGRREARALKRCAAVGSVGGGASGTRAPQPRPPGGAGEDGRAAGARSPAGGRRPPLKS